MVAVPATMSPVLNYTSGMVPVNNAAPTMSYVSTAPVSSIPYHMLGKVGDALTPEECAAFGVPPGSSWTSGPGYSSATYTSAPYAYAPVPSYAGDASTY